MNINNLQGVSCKIVLELERLGKRHWCHLSHLRCGPWVICCSLWQMLDILCSNFFLFFRLCYKALRSLGKFSHSYWIKQMHYFWPFTYFPSYFSSYLHVIHTFISEVLWASWGRSTLPLSLFLYSSHLLEAVQVYTHTRVHTHAFTWMNGASLLLPR